MKLDLDLGGLFTKAADKFLGMFETKEEKQKAALAWEKSTNDIKITLMQEWNNYTELFNKRIELLQGSVSDLKTIPIVGHIIIFFRGMFRPAVSYFTMFAVYQWFSKNWILEEKQQSLLFAMTLIVLIFYFGERTVKNILPIVMQYLGIKGGK